jgi:hypothetical protein
MTEKDHLATIAEIRALMERSSRFISLSGLSGITAGLWAIIGAAVAFYLMQSFGFLGDGFSHYETTARNTLIFYLLIDAAVVLGLAILSGVYFTTKRARKAGDKIWDKTTRRLLTNIFLPLGVGGIFCLILIAKGYFTVVAPATLLFYGLALINGSKYTLNDIRYLGICQVILGCMSAVFMGDGPLIQLAFWTFGFGVLHIIYGAVMYGKYEA